MQDRKSFRRVVTSRSNSGRSFVLEDSCVAEGELGNYNLWQLGPQTPDVMQLQGGERFPFVPAPGGGLVRVFRLPPDAVGASADERQRMTTEFAAAIGLPGCQPDTSRHPFMHVTPTTDYVVLLSGEVSLLLDEGQPIALKPLDVVIQRQTNHAWVNTGRTDAFLLSVMNSRS
jgi:hypothetical protein